MMFQSPPVSRRQVLGGLATCALPVLAAEVSATPETAVKVAWPALHAVNGPDIQPADWADMPAIVVFWETWCPYCKRHNERVEQLYQSVRGKKIRVLGATTETDEAKVRAYVQSSQLHFPVAMVSADFRTQFTRRKVIPLTCLVAGDGQLLQVIPGEMGLDDVLSLAAQVMGTHPKIRSS